MFEPSVLKRASYALTLITGYFLASLLSIYVFIFGGFIALIALRLSKFVFGLFAGSSNRGAQFIGLAIQAAVFMVVLGFLVASPNLEYKHVLVNAMVTGFVIVFDLAIIDTIVFGANVALTKIAPKSNFSKVFVPKVIQELYA